MFLLALCFVQNAKPNVCILLGTLKTDMFRDYWKDKKMKALFPHHEVCLSISSGFKHNGYFEQAGKKLHSSDNFSATSACNK